jgi:hypothetical protein
MQAQSGRLDLLRRVKQLKDLVQVGDDRTPPSSLGVVSELI